MIKCSPFFFSRSVNWNAFEILQFHVNSRNKCSDLPPAEPCAVVGLQLQQLPFVLGGLSSVYRNVTTPWASRCCGFFPYILCTLRVSEKTLSVTPYALPHPFISVVRSVIVNVCRDISRYIRYKDQNNKHMSSIIMIHLCACLRLYGRKLHQKHFGCGLNPNLLHQPQVFTEPLITSSA